MQLIDALEVLISSADDSENAKKLDFTWNLIDYNEDYIWL